jgi:hypothetical protein
MNGGARGVEAAVQRGHKDDRIARLTTWSTAAVRILQKEGVGNVCQVS